MDEWRTYKCNAEIRSNFLCSVLGRLDRWFINEDISDFCTSEWRFKRDYKIAKSDY